MFASLWTYCRNPAALASPVGTNAAGRNVVGMNAHAAATTAGTITKMDKHYHYTFKTGSQPTIFQNGAFAKGAFAKGAICPRYNAIVVLPGGTYQDQ